MTYKIPIFAETKRDIISVAFWSRSYPDEQARPVPKHQILSNFSQERDRHELQERRIFSSHSSIRISIRHFDNSVDHRETTEEPKMWKTWENCLILTPTLVQRDSLYVIQVSANCSPEGVNRNPLTDYRDFKEKIWHSILSTKKLVYNRWSGSRLDRGRSWFRSGKRVLGSGVTLLESKGLIQNPLSELKADVGLWR